MRYDKFVLLATAGLVLGLPLGTTAQVKIGANPTQMVSGAALQVDGDASTSTPASLIVNSTKNLGVGTANPQNRVEITSAAAGNSGLRLTNLPSASVLATNASGDVVSSSTSSVCICGEIKQAIVASLGANWYKMDGTTSAPANSCGVSGTLPNATGALLVQGGTLGTLSGATNLGQSQLPNVSLSGTTGSEGGHRHNIRAEYGTGSNLSSGPPGQYNQLTTSTAYPFRWDYTQNDGAHSHAFTTSSMNGNVSQQPLTTSNLPRIGVNTFVCLRN